VILACFLVACHLRRADKFLINSAWSRIPTLLASSLWSLLSIRYLKTRSLEDFSKLENVFSNHHILYYSSEEEKAKTKRHSKLKKKEDDNDNDNDNDKKKYDSKNFYQ
ncbi:MAG: hypothetical protein ACI90V_006050, partial [Bacillariaceae sp.]|jgi:hypothetical protein